MGEDLAIIREVEKRFDDLREADRKAVEVATGVLADRMAGFPEEFARRGDVAQALEVLQRLDKDKLPTTAFTAHVDNYRIEQARADDARRALAETLATATDSVRLQWLEDRTDFITEDDYRRQHSEVLKQIGALARWQYTLAGGLVFATVVAPTVSALLVYYFTRSS